MSTIKCTTLQNLSGVEVYTCKAWVNFNGTGTVAIRASGNVSSITDNGTGDYTVNFTNVMPDANYVPVFSWADAALNNTTSPKILANSDRGAATLKSTSQYRMVSNNFDAVELYSAVFR